MSGISDYLAAMTGQAFRGQDKLGAAIMGKKLLGASIDVEEQHFLVLHMEGGDVVLEALGDCCSESWFYEVMGLTDLYGHVITGGEATAGEDAEEDGLTRQEYDQVYKVTLEAAGAGRADIIFRNSSNGYYGGWLEMADEVPVKVVMAPITGDYVADAAPASRDDW